jgi:hypothetical protein
MSYCTGHRQQQEEAALARQEAAEQAAREAAIQRAELEAAAAADRAAAAAKAAADRERLEVAARERAQLLQAKRMAAMQQQQKEREYTSECIKVRCWSARHVMHTLPHLRVCVQCVYKCSSKESCMFMVKHAPVLLHTCPKVQSSCVLAEHPYLCCPY